MSEPTWWESIKAEGGQALDTLKQIIREGNVRRIRIKQDSRIVAEFPLSVGVVGAVFAPMLAAVGAIVALSTDCSIEIERYVKTDAPQAPPPAPEPPDPTQTPIM